MRLQAGMRQDQQLLEQPPQQAWELVPAIAQPEQQVAQTKEINKYTVSKENKRNIYLK